MWVGSYVAVVNTNYIFQTAQCKNFVPKVDAKNASYEKNLHGGM